MTGFDATPCASTFATDMSLVICRSLLSIQSIARASWRCGGRQGDSSILPLVKLEMYRLYMWGVRGSHFRLRM